MRDFAFYNLGCGPAKGPKRVLVFVRRCLRRVLRPFFFRQEEIYRDFQGQIDALSHRVTTATDQANSAAALGWDHVALVRRLALLEDQVELLHQMTRGDKKPVEWRVSIPMHRSDGRSLEGPHKAVEPARAAEPR